jgi:hypothetical protein
MKERVKAKAMLHPVASVASGADAELLVLAGPNCSLPLLKYRYLFHGPISQRLSPSVPLSRKRI